MSSAREPAPILDEHDGFRRLLLVLRRAGYRRLGALPLMHRLSFEAEGETVPPSHIEGRQIGERVRYHAL